MNLLIRFAPGRRSARAGVARRAPRRALPFEARALMALAGQVQNVIFSGDGLVPLTPDAGGPENKAPHYLDANANGNATDPGDKMDAACFVQGTTARVTAKIKLAAPDNDAAPMIELRATAPDGLNVVATNATLEADKQTVDLATTNLAKPFIAGQIGAYDPLTITWEVSLDDGKTWQASGMSTDPVYVTLVKPNTDFNTRAFYETVARLSCINGKGATDADSAIPKAFTGLDVKRADDTSSAMPTAATTSSGGRGESGPPSLHRPGRPTGHTTAARSSANSIPIPTPMWMRAAGTGRRLPARAT